MNMKLKNRPPSGRPRATHRIGEWLVENNYVLARRHTAQHQGSSVPRPELYSQSSASGRLVGPSQRMAPSRRQRDTGPRHSTTVDGAPSHTPPSNTADRRSSPVNATMTSSAEVAGGSACRLALVTARGPMAVQRAWTTGWSGHRSPTVQLAANSPPRSARNRPLRGTTRVSGPGQY